MEAVWALGPSTVSDVLEHLNAADDRDLAYNTVMSVMARLADKGYLTTSGKRGKAFVYEAVSDRDGFLKIRAVELSTPLLASLGSIGVAGFIESAANVDERLLDDMERLLKEKREGS